MNLTRLLGALALATGGSLLVSEPLLGADFFMELAGISLAPLRLGCAVAIVFGILAVSQGIQEEKELHHHKGGTEV